MGRHFHWTEAAKRQKGFVQHLKRGVLILYHCRVPWGGAHASLPHGFSGRTMVMFSAWKRCSSSASAAALSAVCSGTLDRKRFRPLSQACAWAPACCRLIRRRGAAAALAAAAVRGPERRL